MSRFGFGISGLYKSELAFSLSLVVCNVKDTVSRILLSHLVLPCALH